MRIIITIQSASLKFTFISLIITQKKHENKFNFKMMLKRNRSTKKANIKLDLLIP